MNKVILRTALITLAGVALAALLVFSLWILCSPQTMASSCEKTGNYSFAVTCADLRYKYTKDVSDLARCAEDGIMSGKDKFVLKYCSELVDDEGFESLCPKKDEQLAGTAYGSYTSSYKSYICGNLSAAQYRAKDLQSAINTAVKGGEQSLKKLVIVIAENNDKVSAQDDKLSEAVKDFDYLQTILNGIN